MIRGLNVAAIIPARAGSKGVKKKNIQLIDGLPLWRWSYVAARRSRYIDKIIVTTDMQEILSDARSLKCTVVGRPQDLAEDTASLDAGLLHAIDSISFRGLLVTLQPTNPIRPNDLIDRCLATWKPNISVMTVNELQFVWGYNNSGELIQVNSYRTNRQQMKLKEKLYHEDGGVYISDTEKFRLYGTRVYPVVCPIIVPPTVNIDDEVDLETARKLLQGGK